MMTKITNIVSKPQQLCSDILAAGRRQENRTGQVRIFRKHKAPILHVTAGDDACFTACADGKALYWTCKDGHVLHAFNAEGAVTALACGRRVLAVADSAGVHKVSFHSTVARDTAALEPTDAEALASKTFRN